MATLKAPTKNQFYEALEYVIKNASVKGEKIIRSNMEAPKATKTNYESKIKIIAPEYRKSVKAVKEISEIKKLLPGDKYALLEMAVRQAKTTVQTVEGYRNVLSLAKSQYKDAEANVVDYEKSVLDKDSEYANILKLIKANFIKEIGFYGDKGLAWTYHPMIYDYKGAKIFLGRPEVSISNSSSNGIHIRFPSYSLEYEHVGTAHNYNSENGDAYCLGEFENIVFTLLAKRQISSLIRLMKDYFASCNIKSEYNRPNFEVMRLDRPKVLDDSYEVWKAKEPKLAVELTAAVAEPEDSDEFEDEEEEEDDQ